jgi:hypothetical protein
MTPWGGLGLSLGIDANDNPTSRYSMKPAKY